MTDQKPEHNSIKERAKKKLERDMGPELLAALNELVVKHGILRVKGFAAIPGKPMRLLIQGVGSRFDKHFDRAWQADEARITRLIVIGQTLDQAAIEAELNAALAG